MPNDLSTVPDLPRALHKGTIGDGVDCYVLGPRPEDAVFSQRGFVRLLTGSPRGNLYRYLAGLPARYWPELIALGIDAEKLKNASQKGGAELDENEPENQTATAPKANREGGAELSFLTSDGNLAFGIRGLAATRIQRIYVTAFMAGELRKSQHPIAMRANQALQGYEGIGVVTVIRQVSGYEVTALPSAPPPAALPAELATALTTMVNMQTQLSAVMASLAEGVNTVRKESRDAVDALVDMQAQTERRIDALERKVATPPEVSADDVRAHLPALAPTFCRADLGRRMWGSGRWSAEWLVPALASLVEQGAIRQYDGHTRSGAPQVRYEVAYVVIAGTPSRTETERQQLSEKRAAAGRLGGLARAAKGPRCVNVPQEDATKATPAFEQKTEEPVTRHTAQLVRPLIGGMTRADYVLYRASSLPQPFRAPDLTLKVAHYIKAAELRTLLTGLVDAGRLSVVDAGHGLRGWIDYRAATYAIVGTALTAAPTAAVPA